MKRSVLILACVAIVLLSSAALYIGAPPRTSTSSLRVELEEQTQGSHVVGYRAKLVNKGLLPVFVGRCESITDGLSEEIDVLDSIQRREANGEWKTVLPRNYCRVIPAGVIQANYTEKLLWPTQALHSSNFFPNVGIANLPFQHGDQLRFQIFVRSGVYSESVPSPEFKIE